VKERYKGWFRLLSKIFLIGALASIYFITAFRSERSDIGLRYYRWVGENLHPSVVYSPSMRENLISGCDRVRMSTIRLLESRNTWWYFQYALPLMTSTNLELAWIARRYVDRCQNFLQQNGWRKYTWGYETPWGNVYTSNFIENCTVDQSADAVVDHFIAAVSVSNWPDIMLLSDDMTVRPSGRDLQRFFLTTPVLFELQRRIYTEEGVELHGLGNFPGLSTGLLKSTIILLPKENAWKYSGVILDVPDDIADEFLRD